MPSLFIINTEYYNIIFNMVMTRDTDIDDTRAQVIISFTEDVLVTLGPLRPSLMSRLKTERFWVNLSLFLVSRFLSMPSIRLSNQVIIAPLLSLGWEEIT